MNKENIFHEMESIRRRIDTLIEYGQGDSKIVENLQAKYEDLEALYKSL